MSCQFLLLYALTVFVASMIPGPSMLLALTHGMMHGPKKTVVSAMGNMAVTLVQASVSMVGLGTLLIASETVFQVVKYAGAAYLVYVGVTLFVSKPMVINQDDASRPERETSMGKMFLQAMLVTAGNPKAIVFFTAVFPQFINPEAAFLPQFCVLLSLCGLIAFCCFMIYAISGSRLIAVFRQNTVGRYLNKIIGGTFVGTGIGLAASK